MYSSVQEKNLTVCIYGQLNLFHWLSSHNGEKWIVTIDYLRKSNKKLGMHFQISFFGPFKIWILFKNWKFVETWNVPGINFYYNKKKCAIKDLFWNYGDIGTASTWESNCGAGVEEFTMVLQLVGGGIESFLGAYRLQNLVKAQNHQERT